MGASEGGCMCVGVYDSDSGNSAHDSSARHARLLARAYADKISGFAAYSKGPDTGSSRGSWQKKKGDPFCPTPLYTLTPHAHAHAATFTRRLLAWAKRKHKRTPPAACPLLRPASVSAMLLLLPKRASAQRPMNLIRPMPPRPARLVTQMRGRRPGCWLR